MTLVVTEISLLGIVQVSDRRSRVRGKSQHRDDAIKSHYASAAKIVFGAWGVASAGDFDIEPFLRDFASRLDSSATAPNVTQELRDQLEVCWGKVGDLPNLGPRGVHVAAYHDNWPFLAHIHCGHEENRLGGMQLQMHFPNPMKSVEYEQAGLRKHKTVRLQNGSYDDFNTVAGNLDLYAQQFPDLEVKNTSTNALARAQRYREMFKVIATDNPDISANTVSIVFDEDGLIEHLVDHS